jgi:hypothetical protein
LAVIRYPLKKKRFASAFGLDACSAYIVKRRLIWRLPGVLSNRKVVQSVRARTL